MSTIWLIARRELASYLRTWTGYIIVALALVVDGILFNVRAVDGEKRSAEVLKLFFENTSGLTMIASVFLSMRLLAEERQSGTLVLLTSSPIKDRDIVLGKFLSGFLFLSLMVLLTAFMPALIMLNGKISFGHVVAGYLGLLLLGSAVMAIGTFGSALARSQVIAAIFSGVMVVGMILMWMVAQRTEHPLNQIFLSLALWQKHFPPFMVGVIHARDVLYYLAVTYFALFAATRVVEARRWR